MKMANNIYYFELKEMEKTPIIYIILNLKKWREGDLKIIYYF